MANWYKWENLQDFQIWHNEVKQKMGLPKLSIDQFGNECLPLNENYVEPIEIDGKLIAFVEDEYAVNLTLTNLRPIRSFIE